jgi:hypothetical protein
MPQIKLKWNKSTFDDVNVDETVRSVDDFKRIVNQLTGVPLHRQKLMAKGNLIHIFMNNPVILCEYAM